MTSYSPTPLIRIPFIRISGLSECHLTLPFPTIPLQKAPHYPHYSLIRIYIDYLVTSTLNWSYLVRLITPRIWRVLGVISRTRYDQFKVKVTR